MKSVILTIFTLLVIDSINAQLVFERDFGNFKIEMDKKNIYLVPNLNDTLFSLTNKNKLIVKNEIVLLKKEIGSYPYQFSKHYDYSNLKYYKVIDNPNIDSESTNPAFANSERAKLLAASDYIKRTKNWLIVNIPIRVQYTRFNPLNHNGSDSLDKDGNAIILSTETIIGGIFIYDYKRKKIILDSKDKCLLNVNKNGILLQSISTSSSIIRYTMMDWKGMILFDSYKINQLFKDDTKLKLIAGDGVNKSIYGQNLVTSIYDDSIFDIESSGFHYVNSKNKCGYFSFSGYHLENDFDFLFLDMINQDRQYYFSKYGKLGIIDFFNYEKDSLINSAKDRMLVTQDKYAGERRFSNDEDTINDFGSSINFFKQGNQYILSKPMEVDVSHLTVMPDPMDPTTWYDSMDVSGNWVIDHYFISVKPFTLFYDSKNFSAKKYEGLKLHSKNEDIFLFNSKKVNLDNGEFKEEMSFVAMDKARTLQSETFADSIFYKHPEVILQSILKSDLKYIGTVTENYSFPTMLYDYKGQFRALGNNPHDFDFKNNIFKIEGYQYKFGDKLIITDFSGYNTDELNIKKYFEYEYDFNRSKKILKLKDHQVYFNNYPSNEATDKISDDEAYYYVDDSMAMINILSNFNFNGLIIKPDPSDRDTWFDSLDIYGNRALDYLNPIKKENAFILYNYKSRKLLKYLKGYNVFLIGPNGIILKNESIAKDAMKSIFNFYSVIDKKGEWLISQKPENDFYIELESYLSAVGIKASELNSYIDEESQELKQGILCSYKNANGLTDIWLRDYIQQPVINFKDLIYPLKNNGKYLALKENGFELFSVLSDSLVRFKSNYFDLNFAIESSVMGVDVSTNNSEILNASILGNNLSGLMLYHSNNLMYYNFPVEMRNLIQRYIEFYNSIDQYTVYYNNLLKSQTHQSGIYDLESKTWLLKPKYDYVTKYKEYFVARIYDLDNESRTLYDIAENPVFIFFNLKGEEIFRGFESDVFEKFGFELSEVKIIPSK